MVLPVINGLKPNEKLWMYHIMYGDVGHFSKAEEWPYGTEVGRGRDDSLSNIKVVDQRQESNTSGMGKVKGGEWFKL